MTTVSLLNSSATVLVQNVAWNGIVESVKTYSTISVALLADKNVTITINHLDKLGVAMTTDQFAGATSVPLFKQVMAKTGLFKVSLLTTETGNASLKLVTKLTNSPPDDESVTAKLTTTQGDLSSDSGKLLVKQNVLAPATDGVLSYGLQASNRVAMKVDADGVLSVSSVPTVVTGVNFCSTSLTHTPAQVVGSAKKVLRMNCFNDGAQVVYVRLHDMASAPVNTDVPICVFAIQPVNNIGVEIGVNFATGVYATASPNVGKTSAFGTVGADEVGINIVFE